MSNTQKYKKAFIEGLGVNEKIITDKLKYNDIPEWDSIGHMTLMSNLEEAFSITIETDDIVDFGSFKKGMDILGKYKISF